MIPSRMVREEATVETATRAAGVGSREKSLIRAFTVAPTEKETSATWAETARSVPRRNPRGLPLIRPLNDLFTKAVDYRTYLLENRSVRYDTSIARRIN